MGVINQGTCQRRDMNFINTVHFSTERPVDKQYVTANHLNVNTIGHTVRPHPDWWLVLFVDCGCTNSYPPISTRNPGTHLFLRGDCRVNCYRPSLWIRPLFCSCIHPPLPYVLPLLQTGPEVTGVPYLHLTGMFGWPGRLFICGGTADLLFHSG